MRCPNCGKNLGAGMPPALCPECGHEFTAEELAGAAAAPAGAQGVPVSEIPGFGKGRFALFALVLGLVGLLLVGGIVWFVVWSGDFFGGVRMPDVVGFRVERATDDLSALGLDVSKQERASDEDAGYVLEQDPEPGTRLKKGARVSIVVSGSHTMPDVIGKPVDEATAILDKEGITYEVRNVPSEQPLGTVFAASIEAGQRVLSTDVVSLSVASPYLVPNIIGKTQEEAEALLTEASFVPMPIAIPVEEGMVEGTVQAVDPAEGTEIAAGSQVWFTVATGVTSQLRGWARDVINIVYGSDCIVDGRYRIGDELRYWLRGSELIPAMDGSGNITVAEANDFEVWYGVVKHWDAFPDYGDAMQMLARRLRSVDIQVDPAQGTATCQIDVEWNWDRLEGEYVGTTSHDVRTVTLWFDAEGYLTWFDDPLSDCPKHTTEFID